MISDPFANDPPNAAKKPCNCNDSHGSVAESGAFLASPSVMEDELRVLLDADLSFTTDLELQLLEQDDGALLEDLGLDELEGAELPNLQGVVELAQRYPGLKITFSF